MTTFALSCSREMTSESAHLAAQYNAYWQTHLSGDPEEMAMIAEQFPEASNYLDVYDRAGRLGPRAIFAHSVHLDDGEIARLVESGSNVAHCPLNVFGGGILDTGGYRSLGVSLRLASDVGGRAGEKRTALQEPRSLPMQLRSASVDAFRAIEHENEARPPRP
jgi:guanine deaminase